MKKHLLLILALLAFVLPARAQDWVCSDLTFYFSSKNNSSDPATGYAFSKNANVNTVFGHVISESGYIYDQGPNNSNLFIKSIDNVTYINDESTARRAAQNGMLLKAGGSITFSLLGSYDVTNLSVKAGNWNADNGAVVTVNGVTFDALTGFINANSAAGDLTTLSKNVTLNGLSKFTISTTKDVIINSVAIEFASHTVTLEDPVFTPASGSAVAVGEYITIKALTPGSYISSYSSEDGSINGPAENEYPTEVKIQKTAAGTLKLTAQACILNNNTYSNEVTATYGDTPTPTLDPCPLTITPTNTNITPGTEIKVTSSVSGASLMVIITKDGQSVVEEESVPSPYIYAPTEPGTYVVEAVASATGYTDNSKNATYTVTAPVHNEVAPKISFSHEDQKVFGSEEEIDVTLTLNHDVYPVPDVIYYTLDGFMAHNTLKTGTPGATPAGHVHTVTVDPSTFSGTVRIERSHREALNHRAVTINAYTFNTAGNDVAAATYIFNDNASTQTAQYVAAPKTATGDPITITASQINSAGEIGDGSSSTVNGYTFKFAKSSSQYTPKFNLKSNYIQFYASNTMTISSDTYFEKIELTCTSGYAKSTNASSGEVSVANNIITWTGNTNTVTFTNSDAGQSRIKSIKIYPASTPVADAVATPAFDPEEGTYEIVEGGNKITISSTDGSTIHYKDNGGTEVTGPSPLVLTLPEGSHSIEAWATKDGLEPSSHVTKNYKFVPPFEGEVFTLVTSADQIKAGDKILITSTYSNANYVAGSIDNKKFAGISINALGQEIESKENYNVLKVVADGTDLYLQQVSDDKYISHSSTDLSAVEQKSNNCKVEFVKGSSSNQINTKFTSDSRYLIYRNTSGNNIFGSYASSNLSTSGYAQTFIYRNGTETVKTPEIALNDRAGDTTKPVTATISCSTDGADVHYSVKKDDVETVADELYSAALTFNEAGSYELTAWATKEGMTASAKASESFTITVPVCQAPAFEPLSGAEAFNSLTVKLSCATEGAQIQYKVNNGEQKVYDANTGIVLEGVGSYTITAWATKEGMTKSAEVTATYTVKAEPVEELFFVMDQNLWDVDGAYPETVVPFEYKGNNTYDLDITKIPAKGWYMNKNGIWTAIEHGFRGNFYVRDGKANHKGLVFGATGTVADATFATRAAAAGNQMVEPHTKYNMYVVNEGETHKVFTTIDDNSSKAFTDGTIRVTHTPGNKDAAKTMTLEILAEDNQTTGVDSITAEDAASDADARFFNLQGVEVPADRLAPGIYIRQAGSKATKVLVK